MGDTDYEWYMRVRSWLNSTVRAPDFLLRVRVEASGHPASDTRIVLDDLSRVVQEWLDGIDIAGGAPLSAWEREWRQRPIRVVMRALLRPTTPGAAGLELVHEPAPASADY